MQETDITDAIFAPAVLQSLAAAASADEFVRRKSTFADLRIGLQSESGARAVLIVQGCDVSIDPDAGAADFVFEGDDAAFGDLRSGLAFNRLVRQHRLHITGDLRGCVQNWLLLYAIFRLIPEV